MSTTLRCHIDGDYSSYTCYGCHEHSRSEIREKHAEEGIYDCDNCVECHRSGDEEEAERFWRQRRTRQGEAKKDGRCSYRREHDEDERRDDD
ncbi:MAG: hypothetical protein OET44_05415 [Gammaproteobacteria bacterium]|nr:hypothetical protein [Gammaproteobacteria bacterium]